MQSMLCLADLNVQASNSISSWSSQPSGKRLKTHYKWTIHLKSFRPDKVQDAPCTCILLFLLNAVKDDLTSLLAFGKHIARSMSFGGLITLYGYYVTESMKEEEVNNLKKKRYCSPNISVQSAFARKVGPHYSVGSFFALNYLVSDWLYFNKLSSEMHDAASFCQAQIVQPSKISDSFLPSFLLFIFYATRCVYLSSFLCFMSIWYKVMTAFPFYNHVDVCTLEDAIFYFSSFFPYSYCKKPTKQGASSFSIRWIIA